MLSLIQLDPEVPAGTFADWLSEKHEPFQLIRLFADEKLPELSTIKAVVVLGGAMGVHDTATFPYLLSVKKFISQTVEEGIPYLGICLGGQLLADVLGARVHSGRNGEKGMRRVMLRNSAWGDPLFKEFEKEFCSFQWHNDSFELPAGAEGLAFSPECPNQAFRYGEVLYGLQFHPEVNRGIVASWVDADADENCSDAILEEFVRTERTYFPVSRKLLGNFLSIISRRVEG